MIKNHQNIRMFWSRLGSNRGVTLVELMMGLVVMALVSTATFAAYQVCQRTLNTDRQIMEIQQQLRGAFHFMERQIWIAGFDDAEIGGLGVADVQRYTIPDNLGQASADTTANASPVLSLTFNLDETVSTVAQTASFYLYDDGADNLPDLCVSNVAPGTAIAGGASRDLVAEDIEAIDFAFAVDQDGDEVLDVDGAGNTIWAIDTNNDNRLDAYIPEAGGNPTDLSSIGGYPATVPLSAIEVVRIWILARTHPALEVKMTDVRTFQVGRRLIDPAVVDTDILTGNRPIFRRRLLTANVKGMNL